MICFYFFYCVCVCARVFQPGCCCWLFYQKSQDDGPVVVVAGRAACVCWVGCVSLVPAGVWAAVECEQV